MKTFKMPKGMSVVVVSEREAAVFFYPEKGGMMQNVKYDFVDNSVDEVARMVGKVARSMGNNFEFFDVTKEPLIIVPIDQYGVEGDYSVDVRSNDSGRLDVTLYNVNVLEHIMEGRPKEYPSMSSPRVRMPKEKEQTELQEPELGM